MQPLEIMPPTWYSTVFHWTVLGTMLAMITACFTNRIYSASTRKSFDTYAKFFVILITATSTSGTTKRKTLSTLAKLD